MNENIPNSALVKAGVAETARQEDIVSSVFCFGSVFNAISLSFPPGG